MKYLYHHGMGTNILTLSDLRLDRRMIDYINMLRSGLCEYAVNFTVSPEYAAVTVRLLRVLARCTADSFRQTELDAIEVTTTHLITHINMQCTHYI